MEGVEAAIRQEIHQEIANKFEMGSLQMVEEEDEQREEGRGEVLQSCKKIRKNRLEEHISELEERVEVLYIQKFTWNFSLLLDYRSVSWRWRR